MKYKALLPGGETLTLQKLITGAEEKHEAGPKKYELLYKAGLLAAVDNVSIKFVMTTWQKKYVGDKTHYVPLEGNCPGKATRKS